MNKSKSNNLNKKLVVSLQAVVLVMFYFYIFLSLMYQKKGGFDNYQVKLILGFNDQVKVKFGLDTKRIEVDTNAMYSYMVTTAGSWKWG